MSLTMITVLSVSGESVELPIGGSQGYQLEEVEGLDPVKATISSSNFGWADGASYQTSRRDIRNIVMRVGLIPDFLTTTVQSLRLALARKMMPKSQVILRFHDSDGTVLRTVGRVESFEAPLFVQDPKINISILCMDPDFISERETVIEGASVPDITNTTIDYDGTVATGFRLGMTMDRPTNEISFVLQNSEGVTERMDFAMSLVAGDKLEISSVFGSKGVWVTKPMGTESALYAATPNSHFLSLTGGSNSFRVQAPGAPIPYKLRYYPRYGGL